jgi:hypothetical protein
MDLLTRLYLIRQVFSGYSAPFFFMASHPFRSTLKMSSSAGSHRGQSLCTAYPVRQRVFIYKEINHIFNHD